MSLLCRLGWHRWLVRPGPEGRFAVRTCRVMGCGLRQMQLGDGPSWMDLPDCPEPR